jgi:hypothetical protein
MKWYLWIVAVILAINTLVIIAVGLFLLADRLRARRDLSRQKREGSHERPTH